MADVAATDFSIAPAATLLNLRTWLCCAICAYWLLVKSLRYRRRDSVARKYDFPDRSSWSRMTLKDAQAIQRALSEQEFPNTFSYATFFALFKTYGIPSISKLLVATGQLSASENASKRAMDTGVVITEVVLNPPDSERALSGIALMNFLHGRYIKAGKISNDDMLYTLSLFVLEPVRWVAKYEWRTMSDLEICAMGVFWKDLGEVMNISYNVLPSVESGWQDGFHWLKEMERWSLEYEAQNMIPADSNEKLAHATFDLVLFNVPNALRPYGYSIASSLLETRLRTALRLEEPPSSYERVLNLMVEIRRVMLRNLFLPRPKFMRLQWFTPFDQTTGRAHFCQYVDRPWYIKPTFLSRWGPKALLMRLLGGHVPGAAEFRPQGYRIHELGPDALVGKGTEEMEQTKGLLRARRAGCMFSRSGM